LLYQFGEQVGTGGGVAPRLGLHVPAWFLDACDRQHVVSVDLRRQH
jgi:hypothetical protein